MSLKNFKIIDPILAIPSITEALKTKKTDTEQRELLTKMGFSPICLSTHQEGVETIIIHFGTGGTSRGYVAVESTIKKMADYTESSDTKNPEFFIRTSIPKLNYDHTGF